MRVDSVAAAVKVPPPPPPLVPVQGTFTVDTVAIDNGALLGFADAPDVDADQVDRFARRIAEVLDAHLDAIQGGEPDLRILSAGWVEEAADGTRRSMTFALADRDNPVTTASYTITIQVEDVPTIAVAQVDVIRFDGTLASVELVFDITDGEPRLELLRGGTS